MKIVVNIGCLECGVSSNIVGIFDDDEAERIAQHLRKTASWREEGQNAFLCFPLPAPNVPNPDYFEWLASKSSIITSSRSKKGREK